MKIVAIEEHLGTPEIGKAWSRLKPPDQDDSQALFAGGEVEARLENLSDARIQHMDECGVDMQVLSLTTPSVQNLDAADAILLVRRANDLVAAAVLWRPDRFGGFATLPTPTPVEATRELKRAVSELGLSGAMLCGRTWERDTDHPDFLPIYEAATALRLPLYMHPQIPTHAVRNAYYSGLGDELDLHFATGGIGWHYEAGAQVLRLILLGAFDRYPNLQVITGHWGEAVLFNLERIDLLSKAASHFDLPVADYFRRNVSVTPNLASGTLSWRMRRPAPRRIPAPPMRGQSRSRR